MNVTILISISLRNTGTKNFINPDSTDFCVMIGMCIDGVPVLVRAHASRIRIPGSGSVSLVQDRVHVPRPCSETITPSYCTQNSSSMSYELIVRADSDAVFDDRVVVSQ